MARTIKIEPYNGGGVTITAINGVTKSIAVANNTSYTIATSNALTTFTAKVGPVAPSTGTLVTQGVGAGVWSSFFASLASSDVVTASPSLTATTVTFTVAAGKTNVDIYAYFKRAATSSSVWSPADGNVIVVLLDRNGNVWRRSDVYCTDATKWAEFAGVAFAGAAFTCAAGGVTRNWYPATGTENYTKPAYLMNVASLVPSAAVLSMTPGTGYTVKEWRYELGASVISYGNGNSAEISDFAEGCKIYLVLTQQTSNPSIVYDGFDDAFDIPLTQVVTVAAEECDVGKVWTSPTAAKLKIAISPKAWQTITFGQMRYVVVDGEETLLANEANTTAYVESKVDLYSLTHVVFKQVAITENGALTVTVNMSAAAELAGIEVEIRVGQGLTPLAVFDELGGEVGYFRSSTPLAVDINLINPEGVAAGDFVLRLVADGNNTTDSVSDTRAILLATLETRALTVYIEDVTTLGAVTATKVNLARDTSAGAVIATSATSVVDSYAGSLSVSMPTGESAQSPITATCTAQAGYTVTSLYVYSEDELTTYYSGPAVVGENLIYINTEADVHIVLVLVADILSTPTICGLLSVDDGKFTASIDNPNDDFRVGDVVTLHAAPLTGLTDVGIGAPLFNDQRIVPVRDGLSIAAEVSLGIGSNVFKVPVYAVFATDTTSADDGEGTIVLTTSWEAEDTLTVDMVEYRRLGYRYTVTAPLMSTSPDTYTVAAAKVLRRLLSGSFAYNEVGFLEPVVVDETTREFSAILSGPTRLLAVYAVGTLTPYAAFAAYDYTLGAYITQGVRPQVTTSAVSPAVLSENVLADVTWPTGTDIPSDGFVAAAFLVRQVTSSALALPSLDIFISSERPARLEIWDAATDSWIPYGPSRVVLIGAFTFFRASTGDPPSDLVDVTFEQAVSAMTPSVVEVAGCVVYVTNGAQLDTTVPLVTGGVVLSVKMHSVLHVWAVPISAYEVTGWYINDVLIVAGASFSLTVSASAITLRPLLTIRAGAPITVMVLNGSTSTFDEGVWVSKLFRAQQPWRPLTAHVEATPATSSVILGVLKGARDAPEVLDDGDPGTVSINAVAGAARRLPPGQIQKSRFVRYMVMVSGVISVSSVAVCSGMDTLKKGH